MKKLLTAPTPLYTGLERHCRNKTSQIELRATMETGIRIEVIGGDDDVNKIAVSARNGKFRGETEIYVAIGELKEAAERLRGFPKSPADAREIAFGQFDLEPFRVGESQFNRFASGVSMRFYCVDGSGHAYVDVRVQADYRNRKRGLAIQGATLDMRVEAAAVDAFVQELLRVEADLSGAAHLKASDED
jgi:hypothetical protein